MLKALLILEQIYLKLLLGLPVKNENFKWNKRYVPFCDGIEACYIFSKVTRQVFYNWLQEWWPVKILIVVQDVSLAMLLVDCVFIVIDTLWVCLQYIWDVWSDDLPICLLYILTTISLFETGLGFGIRLSAESIMMNRTLINGLLSYCQVHHFYDMIILAPIVQRQFWARWHKKNESLFFAAARLKGIRQMPTFGINCIGFRWSSLNPQL